MNGDAALVTDPVAVLVVLMALLAAIFWFGETGPGKRLFGIVPSLVFCYFVPTTLTTLGVLPADSPVYDWIKAYLLPASLMLLILALDVPGIIRLGPKAALVALAAGVALPALFHPDFYLSFNSILAESNEWGIGQFLPRLKMAALTLVTFFWKGAPFIYHYPPPLIYWIAFPLIAAVLMISSVFMYLRRGWTGAGSGAKEKESLWNILFFLLWVGGTGTMAYILLPEPPHAMGAKYLAVFWPFFAFVPLLILKLLGAMKPGPIIIVCCFMALFGSLDTLSKAPDCAQRLDSNKRFSRSEMILIDNVKRGILLSAVRLIPNDTPVFAADQRYIPEHVDLWKPEFGPGGAYVSVLLYENTAAGQQAIVDLIGMDYEKFYAPGPIDGAGSMFIVNY